MFGLKKTGGHFCVWNFESSLHLIIFEEEMDSQGTRHYLLALKVERISCYLCIEKSY